MDKITRKRLLRALIAADNAFNASLRESGFVVYHGGLDAKEGRIYDANDKNVLRPMLGKLRVDWKLNK